MGIDCLLCSVLGGLNSGVEGHMSPDCPVGGGGLEVEERKSMGVKQLAAMTGDAVSASVDEKRDGVQEG
jgi:hypothetical protein